MKTVGGDTDQSLAGIYTDDVAVCNGAQNEGPVQLSLLVRNVARVLDLSRGLPLGLHLLPGLRHWPQILVRLVALLAGGQTSGQVRLPTLDL